MFSHLKETLLTTDAAVCNVTNGEMEDNNAHACFHTTNQIHVNIADTRLTALVDTGATCSLISYSTVRILKQKHRYIKLDNTGTEMIQVTTADDTVLLLLLNLLILIDYQEQYIVFRKNQVDIQDRLIAQQPVGFAYCRDERSLCVHEHLLNVNLTKLKQTTIIMEYY